VFYKSQELLSVDFGPIIYLLIVDVIDDEKRKKERKKMQIQFSSQDFQKKRFPLRVGRLCFSSSLEERNW